MGRHLMWLGTCPSTVFSRLRARFLRPQIPHSSPLLLHQPNPTDRHSPVHRLAHVVNREQGHTHGRQGFHFHAGLACAFACGVAQHAVRRRFHFKLHSHPGQTDRMAQRDQLAGAFGPLNAGDAAMRVRSDRSDFG